LHEVCMIPWHLVTLFNFHPVISRINFFQMSFSAHFILIWSRFSRAIKHWSKLKYLLVSYLKIYFWHFENFFEIYKICHELLKRKWLDQRLISQEVFSLLKMNFYQVSSSLDNKFEKYCLKQCMIKLGL
jgi:hypothetical protein